MERRSGSGVSKTSGARRPVSRGGGGSGFYNSSGSQRSHQGGRHLATGHGFETDAEVSLGHRTQRHDGGGYRGGQGHGGHNAGHGSRQAAAGAADGGRSALSRGMFHGDDGRQFLRNVWDEMVQIHKSSPAASPDGSQSSTSPSSTFPVYSLNRNADLCKSRPIVEVLEQLMEQA